MRKNIFMLGASFSSLLAMGTTAAYAQETQANDLVASDQTGDIVVTAQGRSQQLRDVPVSVSVTSGDSLAQNNIVSLQELSTRLPNIRVSAGPASNILTIRGVGSGLNMGFEQSVGTFVDGVYRGRSRSTAAALFDLDRVEVLRGPQSTFFGNNVIAGALNIASRKPSRNFGANATALYSPSDGEYSIEAGVDLPASDALSVRLAGKILGMDGYVKNIARPHYGPRNRDGLARASLRWEHDLAH
ncbi:TonB-dependent Receptor Plug Domain [Sphingobium faniae]|nr:TonB-dependent Receptor Plug Domain [Sphingobium faniae]